MSTHGVMQRFQGKVKAGLILLGKKGIVDAKTGAQLLGGTPTTGLTAHAGGTRALAVQMAYGWNRVAVCATNGDSVALPAALAGTSALVIQDGAANAQVFALVGTSDTIDGIAAATGVVLSAAKRAWFYCLTDGAWQSLTGVKAT